MVLFWEVLETLGNGATLQEVGHHWTGAFEEFTCSPVLPSALLPAHYKLKCPLQCSGGHDVSLSMDPESTEPKTVEGDLSVSQDNYIIEVRTSTGSYQSTEATEAQGEETTALSSVI